jgi:hypothetical protein
MTQTIPLTVQLGPDKTGLTIGYRVLNLDGTTYSAFTSTGVAETNVSGTYRVANGVVVPDDGGYIVVGEIGTDLVEGNVDAIDTFQTQDRTKLDELHRFRHLDPSNPITTDKTGDTTTETDGTVIITHVVDTNTETVVSTRTG